MALTWATDVQMLEVTVVADPPAERLRIRKGSTVRWTDIDGVVRDFRVLKVSMPDKFGRVTVSAEPV
jgi:hypothetical protein